MPGKQIDFPPKQRHDPKVDVVLWVISIVCIILVVIAIQTVGGGGIQ
jgi:hypothetical protein